MPLETPTVFFIYKRLELAEVVFREIAAVQPKQLFIIADGPKTIDEKNDCQQTRQRTLDLITWKCDLKINFSETNLGCRRRISSGLNWVFSHVNEAIILEDDCLPNASFFNFCQTLLEYYRSDTRIWMISGDNFQRGRQRGNGSYYFSYYPHCWGWATWKRAWQNYDDDLHTWSDFKDLECLKSIFQNPTELKYWENIFDNLEKNGQPDSWAYRWAYSCWKNNAMTILPKTNLVSNIGFGKNSTHTHNSSNPVANLATKSILLPLKHPSFIIRDHKADEYTFEHVFGDSKDRNRFKERLLKILKKPLKHWS
ncbi:MAG: glycosyltransferase family 2 protein [Cyanobacteria bacterium P01_D01_bin.156]